MSIAPRIAWVVVAASIFWSGYSIEMTYERAIDRSKARIESLYHQTVATERTVADAAMLRKSSEVATHDLAGVSRTTSAPLATASLLAILHGCAREYRVTVRDLEPGRSLVDGALLSTDLTLRVRGTFFDIVRFIGALSQQSQPVGVSHTELALASLASAAARRPYLDATIHAVLYRVAAAR
jgi:hypothetical protein